MCFFQIFRKLVTSLKRDAPNFIKQTVMNQQLFVRRKCTHTHTFTYIHTRVRIYIYVCVCVYVCISVCVCMWVYFFLTEWSNTYIYIYIYMLAHLHVGRGLEWEIASYHIRVKAKLVKNSFAYADNDDSSGVRYPVDFISVGFRSSLEHLAYLATRIQRNSLSVDDYIYIYKSCLKILEINKKESTIYIKFTCKLHLEIWSRASQSGPCRSRRINKILSGGIKILKGKYIVEPPWWIAFCAQRDYEKCEL